ncbi:uncharacterized protein LOC128394006 [Panonychus citri]|uniref:uncharacterized protein LOC128394006 n=1 Tax=Panonychus citri TaxID=50023 RepID=UPI00230783C4|nr:uncharacterized protein LOC128394006 [Panonychus citri]
MVTHTSVHQNGVESANEKIETVLKRLYYNVEKTGSLSSVNKLYIAAKELIPEITINHVKNWLKTQLTYTLHKQARKKFKRNKIVVCAIDEQWEADLVEMQEFSRQNKGLRYILTIIDCFSKYAWAIPVHAKTGIAVTEIFRKLFKNRKPESLRTDKGKEFLNSSFKTLLDNESIRHYSTKNSNIKCAIVERFNRTLKGKMFKYFTFKGTRKYTDVLPKLVESYNADFHRSIKMAPNSVTNSNSNDVFRNLYGYDSLLEMVKDQKTISPKVFEVGSKVRIKYELGPFDKSFYPNWSEHIYTISSIDKSKEKPLYLLREHNGTPMERKFYHEELQEVSEDEHRIEKIIKRKTVRGINAVFDIDNFDDKFVFEFRRPTTLVRAFDDVFRMYSTYSKV